MEGRGYDEGGAMMGGAMTGEGAITGRSYGGAGL